MATHNIELLLKWESASVAGAINYDDKYFYSHHANDPAVGQELNAFNLVRIHLFGDEKGSFKKMVEFARNIQLQIDSTTSIKNSIVIIFQINHLALLYIKEKKYVLWRFGLSVSTKTKPTLIKASQMPFL